LEIAETIFAAGSAEQLNSPQAADMFAVYDDKLFSGMCKWSITAYIICCLVNVT